MADGGSSIPARGRLGSAGKGRGSGVGSPRVPFCGLLAAEEQPAAVLGDAGGRWPQGASAPAERWRRAQAARFATGKWSSARGSNGGWRARCSHAEGAGRFKKASMVCRGARFVAKPTPIFTLRVRRRALACARDKRTPTDRLKDRYGEPERGE
jgi:hypothetical protein